MLFTTILGITALLVAGCSAYFSVLGIATLFSGSFLQVAVMASSLEIGKLVATSYLYRHWKKTSWWLKFYLGSAIVVLMAITSIGVFGYLSAAYQINSSKFMHIDSQIQMIEQQKLSMDREIKQNEDRVEVLNKARASQEKRLPELSRQSAAPIYADIERAAAEIKSLQERTQALNDQKTKKDNEKLSLTHEIQKANDVGTFKFVADALNKPLDSIVLTFICILICVFDPLAVSLVLAFNIASVKLQENTIGALHDTLDVQQPNPEEPVAEPTAKKISLIGRIKQKDN